MINNYEEALKYISLPQVDYDLSFNLIKYCSTELRNNEKLGRDIIIRALDNWNNIAAATLPIWNDLVESAGLYPYVREEYLSRSGQLRYEFHKSPFLENFYLHQEQLEISLELQNEKSVVVSAPTSFGKSLLIDELIASKKYKEIVIIQPTLALIDETRKKLKKHNENYKVIVSTSQEPSSERGNIYLFTGERVVEYDKFNNIDFFVIDEFYKLSIERDDDRAIALNQAFSKLLTFTSKFYLLGPMIKNIPINFKKKFELVWYPTEFATVAVNEFNNFLKGKLKASERKQMKKEQLFDLLINITEPTIIYCSAPNKANILLIEFLDYIKKHEININNDYIYENDILIEWIENNINPDWSLIEGLKNSIAFHHGALPRHLGSSIVDLFNNGAIRYLFCTSTLIEGVNTTAKNVILFDKEKGGKPIDFFDYKNIAGRSGRMREHYIGNVIRFEEEPVQMELFVDIPLFNQEKAPLEILISLPENQVEDVAKDRLNEFNRLDDEIKEVIKLNSGISVNAQLEIIKKIEENLLYYNNLLNWSSTPKKFDNLSAAIEICWDSLVGIGDRTYIEGIGRLSARWLASFTFSYLNLKSINAVINQYVNDPFWIEKIPDAQKRIDTASHVLLHLMRHWFDYKLPKWLNVISNLQEFIFKKHNLPYGNYNYISSSLENSFLTPSLSSLLEYDIPSITIKKLKAIIKEENSAEENISLINQLSDEALKKMGLLDYDIQKVRKAN